MIDDVTLWSKLDWELQFSNPEKGPKSEENDPLLSEGWLRASKLHYNGVYSQAVKDRRFHNTHGLQKLYADYEKSPFEASSVMGQAYTQAAIYRIYHPSRPKTSIDLLKRAYRAIFELT